MLESTRGRYKYIVVRSLLVKGVSYIVIVIFCVETQKEYKNTRIIIHKSVKGRGARILIISSIMTKESGREFHNLMIEGRKNINYVSVLANGIVKCWLCPRVDVLD